MPAIYIHDFRLLSSLGTDPDETLARLAADDAIPAASPDERLYSESRDRLLKYLPAADVTRGLATAGSLFFPLIDRLKTVSHSKTDVTAFVFGNSTSGLADVIRDLKGDNPDDPRLWQNLELGRPAGLLAAAVKEDYPHIGPAYVISTACTAGAKAIVEGARLLMSGAASRVIAGGSDILNGFTDAGFTALGAVAADTSRPFCADRDGLRLGEGGALFLLSTEPELNGVPARWRLAGWGETSDAHHISAPLPDGSEARRAIDSALRMAGKKADDIDFIALHGTGTEHNDRAESAAVAALLPHVPAASFKRLTGHQLAGAGAFGAALACALTARDDTALPLNFTRASTPRDTTIDRIALTGPDAMHTRVNTVLVNAFAFGGSNVALLIDRNERVKKTDAPVSSDSSVDAETYERLTPEARASLFTAEALLPQRAPMLLIDRPVAITDDGAVSETRVKADSLLTADGVFAPEGLIEIMAQTVGLFAGARTLVSGHPVEPGLLLGTRKMTLPASPIPVGTVLRTRAEKTFSDESGLWQFACEVTRLTDDREESIAQATLTLFSPPEGYWKNLDEEEKE